MVVIGVVDVVSLIAMEGVFVVATNDADFGCDWYWRCCCCCC